MTAKKPNPAKRGRKVAPPGAKLTQLTVRLPPTQRLGLELLARSQGLSVSQSVERALAHALRTERIGDFSVEDRVLAWGEGLVTRRHGSAEAEALAEDVLASEPFFIIHLPKELRRADEQFFYEVFLAISTYSVDEDLQVEAFPFAVNGEEADLLLRECREGYRRGIDVDAVIERWRELIAEMKR